MSLWRWFLYGALTGAAVLTLWLLADITLNGAHA